MRLIGYLHGKLDRLRYRYIHGFWPEDGWNVDVALARFLADRLKVLASETNVFPAGFGGWMNDEKEFQAWRSALLLHAASCNRYARRWLLVEGEDAVILNRDYKVALEFVAEYVEHLWW